MPTATPTKQFIPLTEYARSHRISWNVAWRRMLTGEVESEKRAGRWYVRADVSPAKVVDRAPVTAGSAR